MVKRSVVLLGEPGHGRSSIVNALRSPAVPKADVGKSAGGITKEIAAYPLKDMEDMQLVDTPGFGSHGTSLPKLIADIEACLTGARYGEVRGLAVTCPVDSPRLMLGTHVVQALVACGLQGEDAWNHIILVGTKSDRSSEEDRQFFADHLAPAFFRSAPASRRQQPLHAMVHKDDCRALSEAIRALPDTPVAYRPPEARTVAGHLAELLGEDVEAFAKALRRARAGEPQIERPLNLLIIGETGDGKSTLINALRDISASAEQECGQHPRGITKGVTCIAGLPIGGRQVNYLDSPGIGDMDVPTMALFVMFEHILHPDVSGGVDGLIVTCPATNSRIRLGGQIVQLLVDLGFQGARKWTNVILAGTKADKAEDAEKTNFKSELCRDFFWKASKAGEPRGQAVLCSPGNYEELKKAIASLPTDQGIAYQPPPVAVLSRALGALLGVDADVVQANTQETRALMEEVQKQKVALQRSAAALAAKEKDYNLTKTLMDREKARLALEAEEHAAELARLQVHQHQQQEAARERHQRDMRFLQQRLEEHQRQRDAMLAEQARQLEDEQRRLAEYRRVQEQMHNDLISQIQQRGEQRQGLPETVLSFIVFASRAYRQVTSWLPMR